MSESNYLNDLCGIYRLELPGGDVFEMDVF